MMNRTWSRLTWRRSSAGCGSGACVEVAFNDEGAVFVRDSKDPDREPLRFSPAEWAAFTEGVKRGDFET